MSRELEQVSAVSDLTEYFGSPPPEPALLALPSAEQAVINVPDKLVQLRVRRVDYLRPGFAQDPPGDPALRGQGRDQEDQGADAERRGRREGHPFPQGRHLRSPWRPEAGSSDRGAITMSLFYGLKSKK